jgi:hypothetical protein
MVEQMRRHWREFRERKPGQRFEDRYRRRRQGEQGHIVHVGYLLLFSGSLF